MSALEKLNMEFMNIRKSKVAMMWKSPFCHDERLVSLDKAAYWGGREIISDIWDGVISWKSLLMRGFSYLYGRRNSPANGGDASLIPGSKRTPGEGNGYPLQFSCLGSPMDRRAWRISVHGVAKELDMC